MAASSRCLEVSRGVCGRGIPSGSIKFLSFVLSRVTFFFCAVGPLVAAVGPADGSTYSESNCLSDCSLGIFARSVSKDVIDSASPRESAGVANLAEQPGESRSLTIAVAARCFGVEIQKNSCFGGTKSKMLVCKE